MEVRGNKRHLLRVICSIHWGQSIDCTACYTACNSLRAPGIWSGVLMSMPLSSGKLNVSATSSSLAHELTVLLWWLSRPGAKSYPHTLSPPLVGICGYWQGARFEPADVFTRGWWVRVNVFAMKTSLDLLLLQAQGRWEPKAFLLLIAWVFVLFPSSFRVIKVPIRPQDLWHLNLEGYSSKEGELNGRRWSCLST